MIKIQSDLKYVQDNIDISYNRESLFRDRSVSIRIFIK